MKRIAIAVGLMILLFEVSVAAQTPAPTPGPEHKKGDVWIGDWTCEGEAKDSPSGPEGELTWILQTRPMPGGFFYEVRHIFKAQGIETKSLEIIGYDPVEKTYKSVGAVSDGNLWTGTGPFTGGTLVLTGTLHSADAKTSKWRNTWTYGADGMSASMKGELDQDGKWWTRWTCKCTKSKAAPKSQ